MSGIKKILTLAVLVFGMLALSQYGPAYLAYVNFNDFSRQEIKFASSARRTTKDVRRAMVSKAAELGIEMAPEDIRIMRKSPVFTVEVDYTFPINMRIYHKELQFHFSDQGELAPNDRD